MVLIQAPLSTGEKSRWGSNPTIKSLYVFSYRDTYNSCLFPYAMLCICYDVNSSPFIDRWEIQVRNLPHLALFPFSESLIIPVPFLMLCYDMLCYFMLCYICYGVNSSSFIILIARWEIQVRNPTTHLALYLFPESSIIPVPFIMLFYAILCYFMLCYVCYAVNSSPCIARQDGPSAAAARSKHQHRRDGRHGRSTGVLCSPSLTFTYICLLHNHGC